MHGDDGIEQAVKTDAGVAYGGDKGNPQELPERIMVEIIALFFKLIIHVEDSHHLPAHLYQLGRQVQVSFNVRRVDDVYDNVRALFDYMRSDEKLLGGIRGH